MDSLVRLVVDILRSVLEVVLLAWLRAAFPPGPRGSLPSYQILRARYGWIGWTSLAWFFAGPVIPLALFDGRLADATWPIVGLAFGMAVFAPVAWVCLLTLPFGLRRFQECCRYFELSEEVSLMGLFVVTLPFTVLGAISVVVLLMRGEWPFL